MSNTRVSLSLSLTELPCYAAWPRACWLAGWLAEPLGNPCAVSKGNIRLCVAATNLGLSFQLRLVGFALILQV